MSWPIRWRVTFYQCGVTGIEPEFYRTKAAAQQAAAEFLREMLPMPGHHRAGSIYRDGWARIVDGMGATEALAEVEDRRAEQ
jgi:hypothetical protein